MGPTSCEQEGVSVRPSLYAVLDDASRLIVMTR